MLNINGIEINFDFTSPTDLLRYRQAAASLKAKADAMPDISVPDDDPNFLDEYIAMLNQALKVYGDFIDDVFGEGVANELLGSNPSLSKILSTRDEIEKAMEQQGKEFGVKMQKYTPNRATRRSKQ